MKEKAFVSIVLYVCNNAEKIGNYLQSLDKHIDENFENFEILIIDDASSDSTADEIRKIMSTLSRDITIIHLAWRHGPEKGILAGVDLAIGDYVIEADMNKVDYDFNLLNTLFQEATRGFDIVSGIKSKGLKLSDRIFFTIFNKITFLPFNVISESVRIVSRRAINAITGMEERIIYRGILYRYSGYPNKTVKYTPIEHQGSKGMTFREKMRLGIDIIVSYTNIGTNVSVLMATIFAVISLILGIYAIIAFLTINVVPGWTTTILFMSICFLGVFTVIGLQGRYISLIIYDIKRRPTYVINVIERSSRQNIKLEK